MTTKELTASQIGRLGALATNKKLTAKERSEKSRKMANARWKKWRKNKQKAKLTN